MKKVAIFILRNNQLRNFLPVIKEMLLSGRIVPVLITTKTMNIGIRAAQNYDPALNPFHDQMEVHYVEHIDEISALLERLDIKVLFSNIILPFLSNLDYGNNSGSGLLRRLKERGIKYILLQYCTEEVANLPKLFSHESLDLVSGFLCQSQYWLESMVEAFARQLKLSEEDVLGIRNKSFVVGWAELDGVKGLDKEAILEKYGLKKGKKIVFFDPVGNVNHVPNFLYKYHFCMSQTGKKRLLRMLRNLSGDIWISPGMLWKLPSYLKALIAYRKVPNYEALFFNLQKFCEENDYLLICKSREKNNDGDFIKSRCDLYTYDRSYLPFTLLELLSISNVYVGFNSFSTVEAAYFRLPVLSINIFLTKYEFREYGGKAYQYIEECFDTPGEWLNFSGVNQVYRLYRDRIDFAKAISGLKTNPQSQDEYIAKFIGSEDGKSSKRILDVIEEKFL